MFRDIGRCFRQSLRPLLTPAAPRWSCDLSLSFCHLRLNLTLYYLQHPQKNDPPQTTPFLGPRVSRPPMTIPFGTLYLLPIDAIASTMMEFLSIIKTRWHPSFAFTRSSNSTNDRYLEQLSNNLTHGPPSDLSTYSSHLFSELPYFIYKMQHGSREL